MMQLPDYSEGFKDKYFSEIWKKIEPRGEKKIDELQNKFPEAIEKNSLKESFFKDVLTEQIDELQKKYISIKQYHDLAFLASFDMKFALYGKKGIKDRKTFRLNYLNKYKCETELREITKDYIRINMISYNDICINDGAWKKYIAYINNELESRYSFLKDIFSYEDLDGDIKAKIIEDLDICVCPYCNRQYINNFVDKNNQRASADIDHFYCKSKFELWAESLYNFVPSCKVCNSLFKGQYNADIRYLYDKVYSNDAYFVSFHKNRVISLGELIGWPAQVKIELTCNANSKDKDKIEREARLFRINEVYDIHKDYVGELIYKKNVIDKTIIDYVLNNINSLVGESISRQEVENLLYGMNLHKQNFNQKPLSKLTYDILKQL